MRLAVKTKMLILLLVIGKCVLSETSEILQKAEHLRSKGKIKEAISAFQIAADQNSSAALNALGEIYLVKMHFEFITINY